MLWMNVFIHVLMQERHNSNALAMELCLSWAVDDFLSMGLC